jgi:tetratricopeptide (TPR) repeat protein
MKLNKFLLPVLFLAILSACTPKTTEELTQTDPTPKPVTQPKVEENLSPCAKFADAPSPEDAETNYVLYRDFLRHNEMSTAFDYWQKVYKNAPAANGKVHYVYSDGIYFHEQFLASETDSVKRDSYINVIFELYDELEKCFPNKANYVKARKGFDYYYTYKDRASKEEIFKLFRDVIDEEGEKAPYFIINPFTALLVDMYSEEKIDDEEAKKYHDIIKEIVEYGVANCKGQYCQAWEVIAEYTPLRLEYFETVKGFFDCDYFIDKYYHLFEANPDDCEVLEEVYSRMSWGGCDKAEERFKNVIAKANENCVEEGTLELAWNALREANYQQAIEFFQQALTEEAYAEKKGDINLVIAKVYYAHLKNFSRSRQYAREAAKEKPNWGAPYILIGTLYASSGPLCGPGRGWDS